MVAIFFGLLFGSIVAIFISFKSKDIELAKNKVIAPQKEKTSFLNTTVIEQQPLVLNEPADRSIFENSTIHLKGSAAKDSLIVVQSPIKDLIISNKQEKFDLEFPLALGENSIKIVVYPKEKQFRPQEKFIKVYFIDSGL